MDGPGKVNPNYTATNDPDVVIGKHGAVITKKDFEQANKNGYAWKDFPAYADYVGGWARELPKQSTPPPPYYRTYGGTPNIPTADIEILKAKYANDPKVSQILNRNIAKDGEVPLYGVSDADIIRDLITKEKVTAQASHSPTFGLEQAVAAAAAAKKQ